MWLLDCGLDSYEWRRVLIVYSAASAPIVFSLYLFSISNFKRWVGYTVLSSFFIAVFGWEIWINFGLLDGQHVDLRRSESLSCAIPYQINWLTNSLGDVSIVWFGIILLNYFYKGSKEHFIKFLWPAFFILLTWFLAQNIWVEAILYSNQVGIDTRLSWAPLMPLGPWFNPVLLSFGERTISFQGQSVWVIATPIYYYLMIYFYIKTGGK